MDRTMVLTIAGFLAVAIAFIIAARIQGKRETAARDRFIASHGWEELREPPADLLAALALLAPVKYQVTTRVVSMERVRAGPGSSAMTCRRVPATVARPATRASSSTTVRGRTRRWRSAAACR